MTYGTGDGQFDNSKGIVFDNFGNILAVDSGIVRVQIFRKLDH